MAKWQKEQSGNPKGRPKTGQSLSELCRKRTHNGRDLVTFYLKVFNDESEGVTLRLEAAKRLEDRGWGKATQTIEHSGSIGQDAYEEAVERIKARMGIHSEPKDSKPEVVDPNSPKYNA